jgi:hypothetical protein
VNARRIITALIAGFVVLLPASALAGGRPQSMSPAAYQALVARGQAMNARYGNAVTHLSSSAFAELWNDGGSKFDSAALVALVTRSKAMNTAASAQFHGLPPAAYQALVAQGRALDTRYGDAVTELTPQQFAGLYLAGGSKLSPQALNALVARSEAMNRAARSDVSEGPATVSSPSNFAWDDFGIGAAAAIGLILLVGGIGVAARFGRRPGVATR